MAPSRRSSVVAELDRLITRVEASPAKLRQARALIVEAITFGGVPAGAGRPAASSRRRTDTSGAIAGRILEILREAKGPLRPAAIVKLANAPDWNVRMTLKEMVADGQLMAAGATNNKTFRLATPKAKKGRAK